MERTVPLHILAISLTLAFVSCDSNKSSTPRNGETPIAPVSAQAESRLRAILGKTCDQINAFSKERDFPLLQTSPIEWRCESRGSVSNDEPIVSFHSDKTNSQDGVEMLSTSGKVASFRSQRVYSAHENSPICKLPYPRKWTEGEAIEVATRFADIFMKSWGKQYLDKPTVQMESPDSTSFDPKTGEAMQREGEWVVRWEEHTPTGLSFRGNGVRVTISESYGPYKIDIASAIPESEVGKLKVISQDQALQRGQMGLDAAVTEIHVEGRDGGGLTVQGESQITLETELPDPDKPGFGGFFDPKTLPSSDFLSQSKARLVWRIKYYYSTSQLLSRGYIEVYIDAQDGSVLCCSYPEGLA